MDLSVGSVKAFLTLDLANWQKNSAGALKSVDTLKAGISTSMQAADQAVKKASESMSKAVKAIPTAEVKANFQAMAAGTRASMAEASRAVDGFVSSIRKTNKAVSDAKKDLDILVNTGQSVSLAGAAMGGTLAVASKRYLDSNKQLRVANSILGLGAEGFDQMSESVTRFAVTGRTGQTVSQLGAGLYEVASGGFAGNDALSIMQLSALGARAGLTEAEVVAKGLSQSLNGMGATAADASRYLDIMFKTVDKGTITFDELVRELGQVTGVGKTSGVSFEEINAALAVLTQRGSLPAAAVAGLRQLMVQLAAPTKEAAEALNALGIEYGDKALREKGLLGVVNDVISKTGGNKELLRPILGDVQSLDAALKLASDGGALFSQRLNEMRNAAGSAMKALNEMLRADGAPLEEIAVNIGTAAEGIGRGVVTMFRPAILAVRDLSERIALLPRSTQGTVGALGAVGAAATTTAGGFLLLAPQIAALPAAWANLSGVFGAGVAVVAKVGLVLAELATGPMVLLAAGLAALAVAWSGDWGGLKQLTLDVADAIGGQFSGLGKSMTELGKVVKEATTAIGVAWKDTVWPAISYVGKQIAGTIVPMIRGTLIALGGAFKALSEVVKVAFKGVEFILEGLGRALAAFFQNVGYLVTGKWTKIWDSFLFSVQNVGPRLRSMLAEMVGDLRQAGQDMGEALKSAFEAAWSGPKAQDVLGKSSRGFLAKTQIWGQDIGFRFRPDDIAKQLEKLSPSKGIEKVASGVKGLVGKAKDQISSFLEPKAPQYDPEAAMQRYVEAAEKQKAEKEAEAARKRAAKKKPVLTSGQMAAWIRSQRPGIEVWGDIEGLDRKTLEATYRLVENAVNNKVKLAITSAYRGNSKTFHGAGMAVDVVAPELDQQMAPATIKRLAEGTGFRGGINEYLPEAREWTGGTGPHVHLATGLEGQGKPGTFSLSGKVQKGTKDVMGSLDVYRQKLVEFAQSVGEFVKLPVNQFEQQRRDIAKELLALEKQAKALGIPSQAMDESRNAAKERLAEVNRQEKEATKGLISDLTVMKLEAEGKMGQAALARIAQESDAEMERLRLLKREYPALAKDIDAAMESVRSSRSRQSAELGAMTEMERFQGNQQAQTDMRQLGVANLGDIVGQLGKAGVSQDTKSWLLESGLGSEAQLQRLQQALEMLKTVRSTEAQISQERLRAVEFEFAMGKLSQEQRLAAYAEDLDAYSGNDELKRQKMAEYAQMYASHLQETLTLQGEFNLETLEQLAEALEASGEMTQAKMAELGALRGLMRDQEQADNEYRFQLLSQLEGGFANFFQGVMTGTQSLSEGLKGMWKSISNLILGEIAKWIAKALVFRVIMGLIGSIFGLGSVGPTNFLTIPGLSVAHQGGVVGPNLPSYFHQGGMVGSFPQLASDEVNAVLLEGEYVMNRSQVKALRQTKRNRPEGERPVTVHIGNIVQQPGENSDMLAVRMGQEFSRRLQGVYQ